MMASMRRKGHTELTSVQNMDRASDHISTAVNAVTDAEDIFTASIRQGLIERRLVGEAEMAVRFLRRIQEDLMDVMNTAEEIGDYYDAGRR